MMHVHQPPVCTAARKSPSALPAAVALALVALLVLDAPAEAARNKARDPGTQGARSQRADRAKDKPKRVKDRPGPGRGRALAKGAARKAAAQKSSGKKAPSKEATAKNPAGTSGPARSRTASRRAAASSIGRRLTAPSSGGTLARGSEGRKGRRPEPRTPPVLQRLDRAAVETGRALAFPMGLSLLVLVFVLIQGLLDGRDPKLARAPVSASEQLVAFE